MKMSLRFTAGALLALTMQAVCFAQHYNQTNLVSNTSGVASVTDPQTRRELLLSPILN